MPLSLHRVTYAKLTAGVVQTDTRHLPLFNAPAARPRACDRIVKARQSDAGSEKGERNMKPTIVIASFAALAILGCASDRQIAPSVIPLAPCIFHPPSDGFLTSVF